MKEETWEEKRNKINHHHLKNYYLTSLDAIMNKLSGKVVDPTFNKEKLINNLGKWTGYKNQIMLLVDNYVSNMSPAILFNEEPLSNLREDITEWLLPLINEIWSSKYCVGNLINNIKQKINKIDSLLSNLIERIEQFTDISKYDIHESAIPQLREEIFNLTLLISALNQKVML